MNSLLNGFGQEIRVILRQLSSRPMYAVLIILTLGVGVGLNSTMFSLANAVLMRPLPAGNPDRLVRIYGTTAEGNRQSISYPDYLDLNESNNVYSGLAATHLLAAVVELGNHSQQVLAEAVSTNYFEVLGVPANLGRVFGSADPYGNQVVILSYDFWKRNLQSSDAIGRTLALNGQIFTIAGVAPESFHGTFAGVFSALWVPLDQTQNWLGADWRTNRNALRLHVIGRLAPEVNLEQARAAVKITAGRLQKMYPDTNRDRGFDAETARLLAGGLRQMIAIFLSLFLLIVGLVLLTVCANLANFVFVRALARKREFALRLAVGASRMHLLRKTVTESLILSLSGAGLGLLLAVWCSKLFVQLNPIPSVPLRFDLSLDSRVYLFTIAASLFSAVILSLPAISLLRNTTPLDDLKQEAGSLSAGQTKVRLRKLFVTLQVAFSLLLLIGASFFLQSLRNAASMDLGFDPENRVALDLDLKPHGYTEEAGANLYQELVRRVELVPGVVSATLSDLAPVDLATERVPVMISKQEKPISISANHIHSRYFETIGMELQSGRDFADSDLRSTQPVTIINEHMAKRFWPDQNPIRRTFQVMLPENKGGGVTVTVVGIARNGKTRTLGEAQQSHFYLPFLQHYQPAMTLVVRTAGDPLLMIDLLQREIRKTNPNLQGFFARSLIQHVGFSLLPARLAAVLSTIFAGLALLLAAIGIYGVIAYSVAQRSREIGVRAALGASPRDILRLFVREGFSWTSWGLLTGSLAALVLIRLAANFLYGISPSDPFTFFSGTLILVILVLCATYFPARRAATIDPITALRYE